MSYIRFRNHYLHTAYLVLGGLEFVVLFGSLFLLQFLLAPLGLLIDTAQVTPVNAAIFALVLSAGTLAMGVYLSMVREGFLAMFFRTLVAFCFLGVAGLTLLYFFVPGVNPGATTLFWAVVTATGLVVLVRQGFVAIVDSDQLVRRVVIVGAGKVASELLEDYRQHVGSLGIRIVGCIPDTDTPQVSTDMLMVLPEHWYDFACRNRISEIVVAPEDRRGGSAVFPVEELLECKLRGIAVTSADAFYERVLKKAKLNLVHPSWILYSEGFRASRLRDGLKRLCDIAISLILVAVMWPFMILTALAIALESGFPILYSQTRVGAHGQVFRIYKFRSMAKDAESDGSPVWASENDCRVTRVGAFIRNARLDELPQLYNVLKGEMSIVGPRPERPEFVAELNREIPFYYTRHYVKPGLMGWAQLNYPYGASVEDAKGKLEYDLYYSKNHSFLIDFLIMIQTVEVILLGKGVR